MDVDILSDNDVIPEDLQNELMQIGLQRRLDSFRVGDITQQLLASWMGDERVTHDRIFRAVGKRCDLAPRTVRYCWETAVFFPERVREEYNMLPFSMFVQARKQGPRWQAFLDFAADNVGRKSVGAIAAEFAGEAGLQPVSEWPDENEEDVFVYAVEGEQLRDRGSPAGIPSKAVTAGIVYSISRLVEYLDRAILALPGLDQQVRDALCGALATLRRCMPDVVRVAAESP